MQTINLLNYRQNIYSQNGEDGVLEKLFSIIGVKDKTCCEFGAWDGIHLSNTRSLILKGWSGLLIEADKERYKELVKNYSSNPNVVCKNLEINSKNSLKKVCGSKFKKLDFLSIDIDGLDFKILENLDIKPRVICIEVNSGFPPSEKNIITDPKLGQSLRVMTNIAKKKGYKLVCFMGNAIYIQNAIKMPKISVTRAYQNYLKNLNQKDREWMFLEGLELVEPYYAYHNKYLTRQKLGINLIDAIALILGIKHTYSLTKNKIKRLLAIFRI